MLVGDGWYNCANFKPLSRKFKPEHAVLFQVKIEYEDIEVDIPCNTTAVVNLPDGSSYKIGSGPYTFDCDVKQ